MKKVNQTVGFVVPSSVSVSPQEQTLITQDYKKAVSYLDVVSHVPTVTFHGQPQKKGLSPGQCLNKIKLVKGVSCVSQCFSAPSVPNAPHVATEISVGGRIQSFWQVWQNLGSNPRVVSILKEGLLSALQRKATSQQVSLDCKQVCKPTEKQVSRRNFGLPNSKASCRKSGCQVFTGLLQPALSCSKAQQKWRPILDLSKLNLFLGTLEMETPESIRLSLQKGEWVTSLDFSDAYFHIPTNQRSRKCPKVSNQQSNLPVHLSSFWFGNGPVGVHKGSQRGKAYGSSQGYWDPPVPRRLVVESPLPGNMPTTYLDPLGPLPRSGLGGEHEVRAGSSAGFQFRWLPVRHIDRSGLTHSRKVVDPPSEIKMEQGQLHSQTIYVLDRSTYRHREIGLVRSSSHEAHTVASEVTLESAGGVGKDHPITQVSPPTPGLVARRNQCSLGAAVASTRTCP